MKAFLGNLAIVLTLFAGLTQAAAPQRVVSLGGAITEIVYALNAGDRLAGVDASSIYPADALQLPKVGYYRAFSVEGVASLQPDLILASDQAGPPQAIEQLRRLGKRVIVLPSAPTLDALEQRIHGVAGALGLRDDGRVLVKQIRDQTAQLTRTRYPQRVLLVSSHTGKLEGAGNETAADAMLKLAGAKNVLDHIKGYKPISAEAAAALKPDWIVTTTMSVNAQGGLDAFLAQPGLAVTPAAKSRKVIVMDDLLLLGFGPRLPEALRQIQHALQSGK